MSLIVKDLPAAIRDAKKRLRAGLPDLAERFAQMEEHFRREVAQIVAAREAGQPVIPEIAYSDIAAGRITPAEEALVRKRGAAVVRGVYSKEQAARWNEEIGDYLTRNRYGEQKVDPDLDKYFSKLKAGRPQIFGIYWSKPQMQARQGEELARTRAFLNGLWHHQGPGGQSYFIPDRECTYADRIRRREPGDATLGLSPHMDGGSVERWIDEGYRQVYRHVFSGNWRDYDPFDAAWRTRTAEIPSPAVCSMFRTYQGWTALTAQGPGDGTLQLLPIANAIAYMLLRPLLSDVPEESLCGAEPGRALSAHAEWHSLLLPALTPIPRVEPGDTVWWHSDVVHAVEDRHDGKGYSNVIYIGAAPWCEKNAAYLEKQRPHFLEGKSAPDFAPENYEIGFEGRALEADLTPLGRKQMGFDAW